MEEITEREFRAYEAVRESGLTNMFDTAAVIQLADEFGVRLTKVSVRLIMKNYGALSKKYAQK